MTEASQTNELDIQPASTDLQDFLKAAEGREYSLYQDEMLVRSLRLFAETLNPNINLVYYPCSGPDISPSEAFPESRVIYVDTDPKAVKALKTKGYEVYQQSALKYELKPKADLVLLNNPAIKPFHPAKQLTESGYLVCNDYHKTASRVASNEGFSLVGYIAKERDSLVFKENGRQHLDQPRSKRDMDEFFIFRKKGSQTS